MPELPIVKVWYTITDAARKEYVQNALTTVDPASGLFRLRNSPTSTHDSYITGSCMVHSLPQTNTNDLRQRERVLDEEFQEMIQSFGIEPTPATVKNPQANFVERIHLTLGNILCTMMLEKVTLDPDDPWSGILSKLTWAMRSTTHSSLNATPGQIAFGRDMLYDLAFAVNWNNLKAKNL